MSRSPQPAKLQTIDRDSKIASGPKPTSRTLIVQKFGGMSLATPDKIKSAAMKVAKLRASGHDVIAVVSAMGKTTDDLIHLAYSVSSTPNRREFDMLLSTGERVSMALFSMALTDALRELGLASKAISFTGSQAGILTDDTHSNARIIDVRPIRVEEELKLGHVVILAGFQGVSPTTKEITTLGRGGTDVTAVAMAIAMNAERCEILKEVEGVLSADPSIIKDARLIRTIEIEHLADMCFWGAKVLHYRSVELALTHRLPLRVCLAHEPDVSKKSPFTEVTVSSKPKSNEVTPMDAPTPEAIKPSYETDSIISVNSHSHVQSLMSKGRSAGEILAKIERTLSEVRLPMPQILEVSRVASLNSNDRSKGELELQFELLFTAPKETLEAQLQALKSRGDTSMSLGDNTLSSVTATCQGGVSGSLARELAQALANHSISVDRVIMSSLSITFILLAKDRVRAIEILHNLSTTN